MSRVGKNPVKVPAGTTVEIANGIIKVKGKLGELSYEIPEGINVTTDAGEIKIEQAEKGSESSRKFWGTARARIQNLVTGVSEGFKKEMEAIGVGYRCQVQGSLLKMNLGFSHEVNFEIPAGVKIACPQPTIIEISGADKQLIGQVAANIRKYRKPEPYKGKGIKYKGEQIRRKEGKKK